MLEELLKGTGQNNHVNGLCGLCSVKLGTFDFFAYSKRSSEMSLIIINRMIFEPQFQYCKQVRSLFGPGSDCENLREMDLETHWNNCFKK